LAAGGALYLGAALGAALLLVRRRRKITRSLLRGRSLASMVLVAILGGLAAPVLLILGLKRADAATASLLLAMERRSRWYSRACSSPSTSGGACRWLPRLSLSAAWSWGRDRR
jgi:hypothetical protein